jgi:hypothetical protein
MAPAVGDGPVAKRLRRPGWQDPRLLVGIALVLLSAIGGALLVQHLSRTDTVLVTSRAVAPGDPVAATDLQPMEVRLPNPELYVSAPEHVPAGAVVLEPVGAGELVPRSAVAAPDAMAHRVVTVPIDGTVPEGVGTGSHIELWSTSVPGAGLGTEEPTTELLVGDAVVRRVVTESGVGATRGPSVEVVVPQDVVPRVLASLAAGDRLDVVPLPVGTAA